MEIDTSMIADAPIFIKGPGTLKSFKVGGNEVLRLRDRAWKHHFRMTTCGLFIDGVEQLRWTPGDGPIAEFAEDVEFS